MIATNAALVLIATTLVALLLLTVATIYYVPRTLPGNDDHSHEDHEHEGNEHAADGQLV